MAGHFPRDEAVGCSNGTIITSLWGNNYTIYCNTDIVGSNNPLGKTDGVRLGSIEECVALCTRERDCSGIVWGHNNMCFTKAPGLSTTNSSPSNEFTAAFPNVNKPPKDQRSVFCPFPNLSKQKVSNGLEFQILCGANVPDEDIFDHSTDSAPEMHAENFVECLENCANMHPLCTRVAYFAQPLIGVNCWPKRGYASPKPEQHTAHMMHSAYPLLPSLESPNYKNSSLLQAETGESYKISCADYRGINRTDTQPLATYHEKTLQDCANRCATDNSSCVAAVLDVGLWDGYKNCYLFDTLPRPVNAHSNYTFIYLDSMSSQYVPPPPQESRPPKAWIAGVVVPSALLVAFIFYVYFTWWRKPKSKKA